MFAKLSDKQVEVVKKGLATLEQGLAMNISKLEELYALQVRMAQAFRWGADNTNVLIEHKKVFDKVVEATFHRTKRDYAIHRMEAVINGEEVRDTAAYVRTVETKVDQMVRSVNAATAMILETKELL